MKKGILVGVVISVILGYVVWISLNDSSNDIGDDNEGDNEEDDEGTVFTQVPILLNEDGGKFEGLIPTQGVDLDFLDDAVDVSNLDFDQTLTEGKFEASISTSYGSTSWEVEGELNPSIGETVVFSGQYFDLSITNVNNYMYYLSGSGYNCLDGYPNGLTIINMEAIEGNSDYDWGEGSSLNVPSGSPVGYQYSSGGLKYIRAIVTCEDMYGNLTDPVSVYFYLRVGE